MNSSDAPPPVDTWSMASARPRLVTAATESPPPTTVTPSHAAIARATASVPAGEGRHLEDAHGAVPEDLAAPAMRAA